MTHGEDPQLRVHFGVDVASPRAGSSTIFTLSFSNGASKYPKWLDDRGGLNS
jgi:hypothetical protein